MYYDFIYTIRSDLNVKKTMKKREISLLYRYYCLRIIYLRKNIIEYCFKYEFTLSTRNKVNEKIYLLASFTDHILRK